MVIDTLSLGTRGKSDSQNDPGLLMLLDIDLVVRHEDGLVCINFYFFCLDIELIVSGPSYIK